jgi:hypothetical protein
MGIHGVNAPIDLNVNRHRNSCLLGVPAGANGLDTGWLFFLFEPGRTAVTRLGPTDNDSTVLDAPAKSSEMNFSKMHLDLSPTPASTSTGVRPPGRHGTKCDDASHAAGEFRGQSFDVQLANKQLNGQMLLVVRKIVVQTQDGQSVIVGNSANQKIRQGASQCFKLRMHFDSATPTHCVVQS